MRSFFNAVHLSFLECLCGWDQGGMTCEGMDGGEFVGKWLVAVECNVLVGMGWFAIDIKVESTVRIVNDIDIKHGNPAIFFDFFCPFYVWVNAVEIVVEGLDVVVVNGCESVVGFPEPREDHITGQRVLQEQLKKKNSF